MTVIFYHFPINKPAPVNQINPLVKSKFVMINIFNIRCTQLYSFSFVCYFTCGFKRIYNTTTQLSQSIKSLDIFNGLKANTLENHQNTKNSETKDLRTGLRIYTWVAILTELEVYR